jgi:hypothetical protein
MGYQVFVQKFKDGDSAIIPFDDLNSILIKYGSIQMGSFGLEFVSNVGDICDYAPLSGESKSCITGITFDRPTVKEPLPEIIYDLLSLENTCFFGPDLEYLQARSDISRHIPESLMVEIEGGLEIISTPMESWPLK